MSFKVAKPTQHPIMSIQNMYAIKFLRSKAKNLQKKVIICQENCCNNFFIVEFHFLLKHSIHVESNVGFYEVFGPTILSGNM